ncbi:MAG TPA: tRNA pseudouridine(55) synthase TruB [Oceanobacillus sp.]|nr:tRNA pseudouridine(55) synthase TruB [Oceanobacillus sp.]
MAVFGFVNVNKPKGATSHDVVARTRRTLGLKKVGHAGTLDPLATGVLVLCLGGATRLSEYVMETTKRYRATVHLGVETDTYDAEGQVVAEHNVSGITRKDVERLLPTFVGEIKQVPPMYSAIKQRGRKLYELARAGEIVEREARQITIYELQMVDWSSPFVTLDVTCSPGTYIRSLAHDLGKALGIGASLSALERTASGVFTIEDAIPLDDFLNDPDWRSHIKTASEALANYYRITLTGAAVNDVYNGRSISRTVDLPDGTLAMGYDLGDQLLAVLRADGAFWKPIKVFYP